MAAPRQKKRRPTTRKASACLLLGWNRVGARPSLFSSPLPFPTAKLEQGQLESDRRIALGGCWRRNTGSSVSSVLGWEAPATMRSTFSRIFVSFGCPKRDSRLGFWGSQRTHFSPVEAVYDWNVHDVSTVRFPRCEIPLSSTEPRIVSSGTVAETRRPTNPIHRKAKIRTRGPIMRWRGRERHRP
jgi:hypothetical protein